MDTHGNQQMRPGPLPEAAGKAWSRKWSFLAVFLWMFLVSTGVLGKLDLLPESGDASLAAETPGISAAATLATAETELPVRIEIPAIDLKVKVANPTSTSVAVLDKELLSGAVRHPSSSKLGETGNVIIFGHSSYLPVVNNKAFKAFNEIQDLKAGDRIYVTGSDRTYVYAVTKVMEAKATEDAIPLSVSGSQLTLVTCDSFGSKSDRFVVTAQLVESNPVTR